MGFQVKEGTAARTAVGRAARAFNEAARQAEGLAADERRDVRLSGHAILLGLAEFADAVMEAGLAALPRERSN